MDHCDRYSLRKTARRSFFIGSNTGDGFKLSTDPGLSEDNNERTVIMKGGPGTGKSTLMKTFADRARKAGYDVVEYYCSSDPDSLDAVRAVREGRSILVCDGTSPHVKEMKYPGAASTIFDLSCAWDERRLESERGRIEALTGRKRECFDRAGAALRAACEMSRLARSVGTSSVDTAKLSGFAERCAAAFRRDEGGRRDVITSAISMSGAVTLDTHVSRAQETVFVEDSFGSFGAVLSAMSCALSDRRVSHEVALCPEDPSLVEALYVVGARKLYTAAVMIPGAKRLNCARFVTCEAKKHRTLYRFSKKSAESLVSCALDHLAEAKKYHFELESIYAPSMDFDKVGRLASEKLYSLL